MTLRPLLLVPLILGCADGSSPAGESRSDTVVVHSEAPRFAEPPEWVPTAVYGEFDGVPELEFTAIRGFDVGPTGEVVLYDQDKGIKRIGRDGRFLGMVAREGQGPGEVRFVRNLAVEEDGSVVAVDLGNARVARFGPEGEFWSIRRPNGLPRYGEDGLVAGPGDEVWLGFHPPFPQEGTVPFPRPAYLRLGGEEGWVDTVFVPARYGEACPLRSAASWRSGYWEDKREPFNPKVKWARGADGRVAFGCPASYEFDVVHPDGRVLRVSRAWEPVVVEDEVRDFFATAGVGPVDETKPAYARILLPDDGRIWVWPEQPSQSQELSEEQRQRWGMDRFWIVPTRGSFDVFEPDGTWLAQVPLPAGVAYSGYPTTPPVMIRGDSLWAVTRDELGVNYVTRFELRWPRP